MAFEYTPVINQDQYRPFQNRKQALKNQAGTGSQPNLMQLSKAVRGLSGLYKGMTASDTAQNVSAAGDSYQMGGTLSSGEAGNASYAGDTGGSAVAGGTEAGSTGSAGSASSAGSTGASTSFGQVAGYAGMAKNAYGVAQGMQQEQGREGRDQGTLGGSLMSTGSGAAQGFAAGGPVGAIVGAALGNESYQWQHGNREFMTSPKGIIKSELTGGTAARDIGRLTGLWS